MHVKILNDKNYKEECYLTNYGVSGYGTSPHSKNALGIQEDEYDGIVLYLKDKELEHELIGKYKPKEEPKPQKSKPKPKIKRGKK